MRLMDRFKGALLGLAAGDALGTTLEFQPPGSFEPVRDMRGGGPFGLEPGQWTDDTSMALCLAESLVKNRGFRPVDQMQRYLRWRNEGHLSSNGRCFDIGRTVSTALDRHQVTGEAYCGPEEPNTAGNGSLMRLAPVPLYYVIDPEKAIEFSGDSSRTTHGALEAIDACRYFGGLICAAANGSSKADLLSRLYAPVPDYWRTLPLAERVVEVARGSFKRKQPPEIRASGYVVYTLEAALWALHHDQGDFRRGALLAVNLGEDADTAGAVYGQLAGALYGQSAIPREWLQLLARRAEIESLSVRLLKGAMRVRRPKRVMMAL